MQERRERMVAEQIAGRGIRDPAVLAAMRQVAREAFVAEKYREYAYDDAPLPIEGGQTISQPYIVALTCEALQLKPTDRVLEVGAGSGYAAAVLSRLAAEVHAIERVPALAELARRALADLGYANVTVHLGDGSLGRPEFAPYDGIAVAAGAPKIPKPLLEQLIIGGRLVIPVGSRPRSQRLVRVTRRGRRDYKRETLCYVRFVPLIGAEGWEAERGEDLGDDEPAETPYY